MLHKPVVGAWKMHGLRDHLAEIETIGVAVSSYPAVDAARLIGAAARQGDGLAIGAQDVHRADRGAHTGDLSAAMLREAGAALVIVGHSKRFAGHHETDAEVKAKAEAAHRHGLRVILCVGETLAEREAGEAEAVVAAQVAATRPGGADGDWLAIAYEPVWAIGMGLTPTAADVTAMHGAIRARLADLIGVSADSIRLLYGGSVNSDNAAGILACANVDGVLVGGASLTADTFLPIVAAA